MLHRDRWITAIAGVIVAGLLLAACGQAPATTEKIQPAMVEKIDGSEYNRVVLTERAVQRIALQTAPVREEQVNGTARKVIPYGAVIYGVKGETWAYTNPQPLTFVRAPITVEYIEGDMAILTDGPDTGTAVVTVGAALLYGADTGIGK